ncbi:MAG: CopG family transcriptional regulator [Anaerolineales bacterium]
MDTQNITLALPKQVLRKVKLIATQRHTSVSRLLTEILEELAARETGYGRARTRHLDWLADGADLGTLGTVTWARDMLHER